jgi:voltage-gated potassium channel
MSKTTPPPSVWTQLEAVRDTIRFYLEDIQTPMGVAVDLVITELVLISTGIFIAQTYPLPTEVRSGLDLLNNSILWLFVVEYGLRLWCAENRPRFVFSIYSIIDLMTILPFMVGIVDVGFIRIFRWFRILRLLRFLDNRTLWGKVSSSDAPVLVRILFTLFAIIFVYSGLIYQVEHPVNPKAFNTFLDAFYFSVVTMTTVGFGDVTPTTEAGRLLTVLMILTGVALIPWQVGDLVRRLVASAAQVEVLCAGCGLMFHDKDARFCKRCGTALD